MAERLARVGDTTSHGGTIISGATRSFVNGKPIARMGDMHSCPMEGHGVTPIVTGSDRTMVEGQPAALVGDNVGCGAVITSGSPDVTVG